MARLFAHPQMKKFISITVVLFIIAVSLISKITFQGVEDQYNLPMEQWGVEMYLMQGAWVFIYSIVLTLLGSLPFAFYFFAPKSDK